MTDSKNQEDFRKISETQQRLDILIEHVESRKEALEEEIQEHLHESLANARFYGTDSGKHCAQGRESDSY